MEHRNSHHSTAPQQVRITDPLSTLADLSGRRAVITGGGGGLGLATARILARRGADVLLGVRNVDRAEDASRELIRSEGLREDQVRVAHLDLLDLASIERFALDASRDPLSILILNAASSSIPFQLSPLGVESQFATNHLGHFALTGMLLDVLGRGSDARIVTVSSSLYKMATLDLDGLSEDKSYSPGRGYNRSKLANAVFALELGRRLQATGSTVRSFAAHPGMARTPMHSTYPSRITRLVTKTLARIVGRDPQAAAVGILGAAASDSTDLTPTLFWGPTGSSTHPDALGVPFADVATDAVSARDLWARSAELTGVDVLRAPSR